MWNYEVQGYYPPDGWEAVTTEPDLATAKETLAIYRANESGSFRIKRVRVSA